MIEVIPAIDIIEGRCVRLWQGDFSKKTRYLDSPKDVATRFRDAGIHRIHMVDLDGARSGKLCNLKVLENVASLDGLVIDYGGGVRSRRDVECILSAGASMVNLGSIILRQPKTFVEWIDRFGPERFLPGIDARDGLAASDGWAASTDLAVDEVLAGLIRLGCRQAFVTDIACDGMMRGPALGLYQQLCSELIGIRLIASGGVRSVADIAELEAIGCSGVIIGKALLEGEINTEELALYAGKKDHSLS